MSRNKTTLDAFQELNKAWANLIETIKAEIFLCVDEFLNWLTKGRPE